MMKSKLWLLIAIVGLGLASIVMLVSLSLGTRTAPTSGRTLSASETRANACFRSHGILISRARGRFELIGHINHAQDVVFDKTCGQDLSAAVLHATRTFFYETVDRQIAACLAGRGYKIFKDDKPGFLSPGTPPAAVKRCARQVYLRYARLMPTTEKPKS